MSYRAWGRLYALAAAVAVWAALALQFQIATASYVADARWSLPALIPFLSSYTVLIDILAALALTVAVVGSPRAPWASVMTAIAIYLVFVFGLHHLFGGGMQVHGRPRLAQIALNGAVPALFELYWLLFVPKGYARWYAPLLWLIYPTVLLGAALWHGHATGRYPYFFLDPIRLGYQNVARNGAAALAAILLVGIVFRAIDRLFRPLAMA